MTTEAQRVWHLGDPEPDDRPQMVDAYGYTWWPWPKGGWWSACWHDNQPATWWWVTAHRAPLKEITR